jgi:hypothetical protein
MLRQRAIERDLRGGKRSLRRGEARCARIQRDRTRRQRHRGSAAGSDRARRIDRRRAQDASPLERLGVRVDRDAWRLGIAGYDAARAQRARKRIGQRHFRVANQQRAQLGEAADVEIVDERIRRRAVAAFDCRGRRAECDVGDDVLHHAGRELAAHRA